MCAIPKLHPMHDIKRIAWVRQLGRNGDARAIRKAAGISVSELAREIDASSGALSLWERGLRHPRPAAAMRWADALEELAVHSRRRTIAQMREAARESGFVHISETVAAEIEQLEAKQQ
jgi:transcriptional regulator with XRE-family HTH domain